MLDNDFFIPAIFNSVLFITIFISNCGLINLKDETIVKYKVKKSNNEYLLHFNISGDDSAYAYIVILNNLRSKQIFTQNGIAEYGTKLPQGTYELKIITFYTDSETITTKLNDIMCYPDGTIFSK